MPDAARFQNCFNSDVSVILYRVAKWTVAIRGIQNPVSRNGVSGLESPRYLIFPTTIATGVLNTGGEPPFLSGR